MNLRPNICNTPCRNARFSRLTLRAASRLHGSAATNEKTWEGLPIKFNVPLGPFNTFGIGGSALCLLNAKNLTDVRRSIRIARALDLPVWLLGKGSNTVFPDEGFPGLVVLNRIATHKTLVQNADGALLEVGSGYPLVQLSKRLSGQGLSGLEFAIGIPGTVGGAVATNAGAHGQDMGGVVRSVTVLDCMHDAVTTLGRDDIIFDYRRATFPGMAQPFIASVQLALTRDADGGAWQRARRNLDSRQATQPVASKSAGCIFRNVRDDAGSVLPAGRLIDQAALKGHQIGAFKVSEMHANYIVVDPHSDRPASAHDLQALISHIQQHVLQVHGVQLEPEVVFCKAELQ